MNDWLTLTAGLFNFGGPPFVIVILAFAYLLWAKFLNHGVLKINLGVGSAVDKVTEVLLVFMALLITSVELPLIVSVLSAVRDLDINSPRVDAIWGNTTTQAILLGLTGILLIASVFRYREPEKHELPVFFLLLAAVHVLAVGALLGLVIWSVVWPISPTLTDLLVVMLIMAVIACVFSCFAILFLWGKSTSAHTGKIITLALTGIFLAVAVIAGFWAYASSPSYVQEPTTTRAYYLSPADYGGFDQVDAFALQRIPVHITSYGHAGPFFNLIGIRYGDSKIEHRDGDSFGMSLLLINGSGNETLLASGVSTLADYNTTVQNKQGILRVEDIHNDAFMLWYDRNTLAANNISRVALEGVTPVVLNSSQYQRTKEVQCATTSCLLRLNLTNRLPVQIVEREYVIAQLEEYHQNVSACRFGNVTSMVTDSLRGYRTHREVCHGTSCTIGIDELENTFQASIVVENGVVRVSRATLRVPLNLSIQIGIVC